MLVSPLINSEKPPVVCLMGPTASGKTNIACQLYDSGRFEIISVDSALIYKGLDIGTAKPSHAELLQYPHHLVDIIMAEETYSAGGFFKDVLQLIDAIIARGKTPLLVGGTILYFNSLLVGLADMPAADDAVRAQILADAEQYGWEVMHQRLADVDPRAAARFKPSDKQRLLRALEVYHITGEAISDLHESSQPIELPYDFQVYALMPDRAVLHQNIATRLEVMWQSGFVAEVQKLREKGTLSAEMTSMRAVGYRQVWQYLDRLNELGIQHGDVLAEAYYKEMQDKALFATRQLAKRQCTWIRKLQSKPQLNLQIYANEVQNMINIILNGRLQ